jgi:general secretion pathway protein D
LSVTVVIVAIVVFGVGSYILKVNPAAAVESKADTEPNKPSEVKKPAEPNAPEKTTEAEKPVDSNDSEGERPERRPRPGREGRMGGFRSSPEDRAGMEDMRARWENATEEEREKLRAQMRERFGGRRPGGRRPRGDRERVRDPNDPNAPPEPNEPSKPIDPNNLLEAINLKDVQMKDVIKKLAEWTGKVIIPADDAMKQKITIYSMKKLPRSKALSMIYTALRAKGIVAEQTDDVIELKPIGDAKLGSVPMIAADEPLALRENKDQVVQKFFKLVNYSPSQMGDIILPLIGEYGYVSADESASSLMVIDTVANLMRIERIISQFDLPDTEQTVTKIFEIHHGNPEEIVQLLETLLSDGQGRSAKGSSRSGKPPSPPSSTPSKPSKSKSKGGAATSVTVGTSQRPIMLIPEPKYNWIIAKASAEDMEEIGQWIEKLDKQVPTILVDSPLAKIENKNQVVQKFFKLENYSPTQMSQVVRPLLSEAGYVSSDETTGQLLVIDTVENLMRIEMIIAQFDVPEAEQTVTEIFEILHGDPSEIVQLLRMLLSDGSGGSARGPSRSSSYGRSSSYDRSSSYYGGSSYGGSSYGRSGMFGMMSRSSGYSPYRSSSRSSTATSVVIGPSQQPVVLIPEPKRKWIIARASAEDMKLIGEWIEKLDRKDPVEQEYETISITYADVSEVANRLNEALEQMPGSDVRASVLIQPMTQARQIVIFGRKDLRDMVRKLIIEVDIPPGEFETKVFDLDHADPDQIKENIDDLYGESAAPMYDSYYYYRYGPGSRSRSPSEVVKVIAFPTMKQVTVIASPENMLKISKQIEEWDSPLDVDEVKPRIIELHNTDPVQMADLLATLFSESSSGSSGRMSIYDIIYGRTEEKEKIVGPLYGQLTFEAVPGTKKIIVISKIPAAYDVVEELIRDLDKAEMGEIPTVITLKYAEPEDLAERLNALFNEPGTTATIRRSDQGLSDYSMEADSGTSSSNQSGQDTTSQEDYRPWWTTGRQSVDEQPISNVIGRIRFIPDPRTKSILVLSPPEFRENIVKLIEELDVPGKQVMVKAVIMQIDHSNFTSLGLQLRSGGFSDVGENAITIGNSLNYLEEHGALVFGQPGGGSSFDITAGLSVTAMIDFLVKKTDAKILNQQTLWTKDNEEAMFFKGKRVAFQTEMGVTQQTTTQSIDFEQVGMTLRVRPSITPENNVDMIINVILSQLTADKENEQPVRTEMDTTTNMIVQHGQTLMLGGILFQTDSKVERKIPLLGDMPLAGGLFRHNNIVESNEELIIFITPYVIDEPDNLLPETKAEIEPSLEKLENIKEELEALLQPDS